MTRAPKIALLALVLGAALLTAACGGPETQSHEPEPSTQTSITKPPSGSEEAQPPAGEESTGGEQPGAEPATGSPTGTP